MVLIYPTRAALQPQYTAWINPVSSRILVKYERIPHLFLILECRSEFSDIPVFYSRPGFSHTKFKTLLVQFN